MDEKKLFIVPTAAMAIAAREYLAHDVGIVVSERVPDMPSEATEPAPPASRKERRVERSKHRRTL